MIELQRLTFPVSAFICLASLYTQKVSAQVVYGLWPNNGVISVIRVDLTDCSWCDVYHLPSPVYEFAVLPDGSIISTGNAAYGVHVFTPPGTDIIAETNAPMVNELGIAVSAAGIVYVTVIPESGVGTGSLYMYDIATNTLIFVGDFPPNIQLEDLYFWNGLLYGITTLNGNQVYQINTANPGASMAVSSIISMPVIGMEGVPGIGIVTATLSGLNIYNPLTGTSTPYCTLMPAIIIRSLTSWPVGVPELPCPCNPNAGTIGGIPPIICVPSPVVAPDPTGVQMAAEDVLQFILCTDADNPTGSIVATSDIPSFEFTTTPLQINITYYFASIVGDSLPNGNVNLNDPCLDISNLQPFIWKPQPTVTFTSGPTDICPGNCLSVNVQLNGSPPFTLNYTTPFGSFTQVFSSNQGMLQICAPTGAPPGNMEVSANSVIDQFCTCN